MNPTNIEPEPPRRRFEIEIKVGGDTLEDMLGLLGEFVERASEGVGSCVTGGSSAGGHYIISEDVTVTHESYFAAIKDQKGAE